MPEKPFAALYEAAAACVQPDRERLRRALLRVPAEKLFACAVRHKCGGVLLHGIAAQRIRDAQLSELTALLRRYAAAAALDAQSVRAQVVDILSALNARRIPHALLKGSARLFAGDPITEWTHAFDIDVFVPQEDAEDAALALIEKGYRYQFDEATIAGYRRHHQHLAPLLPSGPGKPVELHVALMLRSRFSLPCDWKALRQHLELIEGTQNVLRLDAFGRSLHMAMHGAGLHRLGDAVQIAMELRRAPGLYAQLAALAREDRIQPVPLLGVLAAGASLAGLGVDAAPAVQRYLEWTIAREDLPKFCRGRMQLADAWFANGGAFKGPATQLALPAVQRYDGTATGMLERSRTLAGRVVAGVAGAVLARNMTRRTVLHTR
jgi:hypothetical protein